MLGLPIEPGDYPATDERDGVKAFALWALSGAAASCFGKKEWPNDVPVPQAWLEFDVESADAVTAAGDELVKKGHRLLMPKEEPWGTDRIATPLARRSARRRGIHALDARRALVRAPTATPHAVAARHEERRQGGARIVATPPEAASRW